jgi:hypothetical protein
MNYFYQLFNRYKSFDYTDLLIAFQYNFFPLLQQIKSNKQTLAPEVDLNKQKTDCDTDDPNLKKKKAKLEALRLQ